MSPSHFIQGHTPSDKIFRDLFEDGSQEDRFLFASRGLLVPIATPLLKHMGLNQDHSSPVALLDMCCGTGLIRQELGKTLAKDVLVKSSFVSADKSELMVDIVKRRIEPEGWINTEARVLDAKDTTLAESSLTHVAISLGIHLVPDPVGVFKECQRVLKNGGTFGFSTFHSSCANDFWRSDMRAAFASFPFEAPFPAEPPLQAHDNGRWGDEAYIDASLREVGFRDVSVRLHPSRYRISSPEEWVMGFGTMLTFVMNTWWSEEQRQAHPYEEVSDLVLKYLRGRYGEEGWDLTWVLITATGRVEK